MTKNPHYAHRSATPDNSIPIFEEQLAVNHPILGGEVCEDIDVMQVAPVVTKQRGLLLPCDFPRRSGAFRSQSYCHFDFERSSDLPICRQGRHERKRRGCEQENELPPRARAAGSLRRRPSHWTIISCRNYGAEAAVTCRDNWRNIPITLKTQSPVSRTMRPPKIFSTASTEINPPFVTLNLD